MEPFLPAWPNLPANTKQRVFYGENPNGKKMCARVTQAELRVTFEEIGNDIVVTSPDYGALAKTIANRLDSLLRGDPGWPADGPFYRIGLVGCELTWLLGVLRTGDETAWTQHS